MNLTQRFHQRFVVSIRHLQKYTDRWWYAPVIGLLAAIDHFVVVIPTDGLLISSVMLSPKRWIYNAVVVTLGSSLGALLLAFLVKLYGMEIVLAILPNIEQHTIWITTEQFMHNYGLFIVFLVALSPIMQHPAVALAALSDVRLASIFFVVLAGRLIKYLVFAWIASHTPRLLSKIWGIQHELEEIKEARAETKVRA